MYNQQKYRCILTSCLDITWEAKREETGTGFNWMSSTCSLLVLATSMAFGLTVSPMYKWLRFSQKVLLFVLQNHLLAKVRKSTSKEIEDYVYAIGSKYPILHGERVLVATNSLKLLIQQPQNYVVQINSTIDGSLQPL